MVDTALNRLRPQWRSHWPGADVDALAEDVRERFSAAVEAWDLRDVEPLGGGHVALTVAAQGCVVKVLPRGEALLASEAAALRAWRPTGAAVALLDARDDDLTLRLERLSSQTLDDVDFPYVARLTAVGALARRLHEGSPAGLPSLADHVTTWDVGEDGPAFARLLRSGDAPVPLHLDLHGGNALRAGDGWKAIDPHGAAGDRHADVWALIDPLAPAPRDEPEARHWIGLYASTAGMDPWRAAAWVRLRAREVARGDVDDGWRERLRRWDAVLSA